MHSPANWARTRHARALRCSILPQSAAVGGSSALLSVFSADGSTSLFANPVRHRSPLCLPGAHGAQESSVAGGGSAPIRAASGGGGVNGRRGCCWWCQRGAQILIVEIGAAARVVGRGKHGRQVPLASTCVRRCVHHGSPAPGCHLLPPQAAKAAGSPSLEAIFGESWSVGGRAFHSRSDSSSLA